MSVESRLSWLDAPGQFCRRRLTAMGGNLPLAKGSNRSFVDGLNRPVAAFMTWLSRPISDARASL